MPRPLLLIVDAESLRTPDLVSALEGDGWAVRWIPALGARAFLHTGLEPDLLLLNSSAAGNDGYALARELQAGRPGLPLVVMHEGPEPPLRPESARVDIRTYLDPTIGINELVAALRTYFPEGEKLTTDKIFGDLLADLDRPHLPPDDPFALHEGHALAAAPPTQAPLSAADVFGQVLEEVEVLPLSRSERENLPMPAVRVPTTLVPPTPNPPAPAQASPGSQLAEPLGPSDFTLSGISGVNDPFEWATGAAPAAAPAVVSPWAELQRPRTAAPREPEAVEEYGNYFLLEKIAVGGMAELFKAQQRGVQGFQKIVAIKRILPHFSDNEDFVTMFIDEAKLAAQLTHPNIVQIFDLGKAGSSYYIAMEYVNGRDLRTLVRKVREYRMPFPEQVAAFVIMKVAAALDYAHRKRGFDDKELKLVHRDISPQNVILSTEGSVKLVDFGIAKAASKASHTVAGALKGKLLYMSPEQATGQPLDNRSDLYSLGLVLFELLTGERCFQADSELGVLEKVRLGRVSDLATLNPNVSREMLAIVNRALQKGVDHRYPSARFMERDLRDYLQRQGNPTTEHDVAEYMAVLLNGTREHLETLVAARFPVPTSLTSGAHRLPQSSGPGSGAHRLLGSLPDPVPVLPPPVPQLEPVEETTPEPAPEAAAPSERPRWLLPVILALAVILVIMLAVAGWS